MTYSFKLSNGDLILSGNRLATVSHEAKLLQDLRLHLLEPIATDDMHPTYGSNIADVIGSADLEVVVGQIYAEIARVVQERQRVQLARAKTDRFIFGRATLDAGEVILDLVGIDISQVNDRAVVRVTVTTGNEEQIAIDVPIEQDESNSLFDDEEVLVDVPETEETDEGDDED